MSLETNREQSPSRHLFIPEGVDEDAMMQHARKILGRGEEVWIHKHPYSVAHSDEFGCVHLSPNQTSGSDLTAQEQTG